MSIVIIENDLGLTLLNLKIHRFLDIFQYYTITIDSRRLYRHY